MNKLVLLLYALVLAGCATITSAESDETARLHMQIAVENIKNENYPVALKELLIAEKYSPNNPYVQANLGLVYFMREKYELAEKHYLKSISIKSDFTESKNNLARAYIEIGQYTKAKNLLDEVLADLTYSNYSKAQANYGILQFKLKNYPIAITYLKKSLEFDRNNCFTHVYLGRTYLEAQDTKVAIAQLDKAISFCEQINADEAHYYSAIAYYRDNQKEKAKFRFSELLRIYPNGAHSEKARKMLELIKKGGL